MFFSKHWTQTSTTAYISLHVTYLYKIRRNFLLWGASIKFLLGGPKSLKRDHFDRLAPELQPSPPAEERAVPGLRVPSREWGQGSAWCGRREKLTRWGEDTWQEDFKWRTFQVKTTRRAKYKVIWKNWKRPWPVWLSWLERGAVSWRATGRSLVWGYPRGNLPVLLSHISHRCSLPLLPLPSL